MMTDNARSVSYAIDHDVAVIRLDRAPVNAIDLPMIAGLERTLDELAYTPQIRGLVLAGAGANFSAGLDLKIVPTYAEASLRTLSATINRVILKLYGQPLPTVAAIRGAALGGGFCLALACDYRICSERDAKLGLPEVTAGIPYPAGPLELVQAELDPALRRRLALFGATLTPPAALEAGVVDELAPDAELAGRAVEATLRLAHLPAYAAVKKSAAKRCA